MIIRPYRDGDEAALWSMLEPVFRAGETYAIERDISRVEAVFYWTASPKTTFVVEADGTVLGTYYVTPNQRGGGAHVCNCGYITAPAAQGKGIARAMLAHSQEIARGMGFAAMQFNFVLASNDRAIATWKRDGFDIVGRLPNAYLHPKLGYVDACVMFKTL